MVVINSGSVSLSHDAIRPCRWTPREL